MNRREFGKQMAVASVALVAACKGDAKKPDGSPKPNDGNATASGPEAGATAGPPPALDGFDATEAAILRAALDRLIPAAHGLPSASQAHAAVCFARQVTSPKYAKLGRFLKRGLKHLDRICQRDHSKPFAQADEAAQDDVLQRFQVGQVRIRRFNSRRWFELMLLFGIEGYMCHPVHGGNHDAIAWRSVGIYWPKTLGTMHHGKGHP